MTSMRGRKRTEDPTPNRARDIQRAFRARRANHLESLEQRIRELDEENSYFRKLLNLPPANRPPLGKGPTGRGVAKSRSRINGMDGSDSKFNGSPEPSDCSSTPPVDYGLSLSAVGYAPQQVVHGIGVGEGHSPDIKIANEHSPELFADSMLHTPVPQYSEVDGNAHALPFGYHRAENIWPINPDVPSSAAPPTTMTEITPTMETARCYYAYTPTDHSQSPNGISQVPAIVHHPAPEKPLNYGHRRTHTEPQSFGSSATPFSPTHRSCNSSSFLPVQVHDFSPSPPPINIRSTANMGGFRN